MKKQLLYLLMCLGLCVVPVMGQDAEAGYQEAMRRIEEARMSGDIRLDLSGLELKKLPIEVGQLTSLQHLSLRNNLLTVLSPEITQLANLQELYLTGNQLSSLPLEIGKLSNLSLLDLENNQLTSLPSEIGQLTNLRELYLSSNHLASLPPEIGQLTKLQNFYVAHNPLKYLPIEFERLSQLVDFYGPPLVFPPPEIVLQGTPAILAYLRDYHAMLVRQTIATVAAGVGVIAGILLAFRWRQRRALQEKKKHA